MLAIMFISVGANEQMDNGVSFAPLLAYFIGGILLSCWNDFPVEKDVIS